MGTIKKKSFDLENAVRKLSDEGVRYFINALMDKGFQVDSAYAEKVRDFKPLQRRYNPDYDRITTQAKWHAMNGDAPKAYVLFEKIGDFKSAYELAKAIQDKERMELYLPVVEPSEK